VSQSPIEEQTAQLAQRLRDLQEHGPSPQEAANAHAALSVKLLAVSARQRGMPPDEIAEFLRPLQPPFECEQP